MKYLWMLVVLSACGTEPVDPPRMNHAQSEIVDFALDVTEEAWLVYFEPVSIREIMAEHPIDIWYLDELPCDEDKACYGWYFGDIGEIQVQQLPETDWATCVHLRYVLSHELMHYLADVLPVGTNEENSDHMTPQVFAHWAYENDLPGQETTEGLAYMWTYTWCVTKWGQPE